MIILLLIILIVYLTLKIKKEKKFRKELAAAGLLYFKEGVTKSINPDIGIDEQAELLPYKEEFEFPAEKLMLGMKLIIILAIVTEFGHSMVIKFFEVYLNSKFDR